MAALALYLLGPPRVERDAEEIHIGRRKAFALLAYLALTGQRHQRDALATLLWPGYDQSTARAHLRRALAALTKRLGGEWLVADRETIGPDHSVLVWQDVHEFQRRLAVCDAHDHPLGEGCEECREWLTAAVELYRDDFLAGFTLPDSPGIDEWQRYQTQRLRDDLAGALERLATCLRAAEDWEPAIAQARRWLALDPTHEPAHRLLMELYVAAGRRGAALRQYRGCMRILEQELGIPPVAETTALYERIRTQGLAQRERVFAALTPAPGARSLPAFLTAQAEPMAREQEVFVARERELALLQGHLERALAGQGQVVFVTGGPGRGKSTLLRQFAAGAPETYDDLLVASGSCNAVSGVGDPYLPFREALGMLTGDVEARWAAGTITGAHARRLWAAVPLVARALLAHGPHLIDALVPGAPLLGRATAAASDGQEWLRELQGWVQRERSGRSDLEQRGLFTQFTNTLCSLSERRPLLLLLDDLQWADSGSVGLLFHLGRFLGDAGGRLLIVGAYRPEEVTSGREGAPHPLGEVLAEFKRRFGEVWVDLTQADARQGRRFVDAYLDSEPNRLTEGFRAALFAHTGGHPLFTVELLRTLQAQGELIQDQDGAWVEGAALDWGHLPARVEGVIEARVGRLSPELRELLMVASVEGEAFTAQVVARVLDQPERRVLRALSQELGRGGQRLVRELGEAQVERRFLSRYQFAHALFQAYLYGTLSAAERRLLHHEVATALEGLYSAQVDAVVVPLAHHYLEAGRTEQAIAYALRAGDQAYHAYANDEAVLYFQRVLDLLPPAGGDERNDKQRLAALSGLGRVRFRAGQLEAAEHDLHAAIALGREIAMSPPDLLRLYYYLGEALWWQGNFREMLRTGQAGLALLGGDDESAEAALMYDTIAVAHSYLGNSGEWHKLLLRTGEFLQELPYSEELRAPYVHITSLHYVDKRVENALGWIEALKQPATRHQDLRALGSAQYYRGKGLILQGDYQHYLSYYQQAVELFAKIGDEKEVNRAYSEIAEYYLTLGDLDTAEQYATRALAGGETVGSELLVRGNYVMLGEIALARRSWQAAREHLESAAHYRAHSFFSALAIRDLGWTFLAQGDHAAALDRFKDALAAP